MKRSIRLLLGLMLVWLAAGQGRAYACSCAPPPTPSVALSQATTVFAGRVTAIDPPGGLFSSSASPVKATVAVSQVWKGPVSNSLVVETASANATCGYTFEVGRDYLIYATGAPDRLQVSLCSRTQLLAGAVEDLQMLGAGQSPPETPDEAPASLADQHSTAMVTVKWSVAILALLALGVAARRLLPHRR